MEPKKQVEIQLGHLCNNRCVFCTSGQQTARGLAKPQSIDPALGELRAAFDAGNRKVTLLGGEPTLQPRFFDIVRAAAEMGYEEIVVFSNGVRTAREEYVDQLIEAAGPGRLRLRFSFQGGDQESHERTTLRKGSFARLMRSLEIGAARGVPMSVNTCVVDTNYASLDKYPALFEGKGLAQVHVDMVRPLDAGDRTQEELERMMPRYSELAPTLLRMARGFPAGFDVNVGNVPYCIEPALAPWIHHDGETTTLVSADTQGGLCAPVDKYESKRERDKVKPESCSLCVLEDRCGGVTETYLAFHGAGELVPISAERMRAADPENRLFAAQLRPLERALIAWAPPAPLAAARVVRRGEILVVTLLLEGSAPLVVRLVPPGGGFAGFEHFSLELESAPVERGLARAGLDALTALCADFGGRVRHPLGDDALQPLTVKIAARLGRLRRQLPFGALSWTGVRAQKGGDRVELDFTDAGGARAMLWLASMAPEIGYKLIAEPAQITDTLREGIAGLLGSLRGPATESNVGAGVP